MSSPLSSPSLSRRAVGRATNALDGLTIVLPCFNEAETVAQAVAEAVAAAARAAYRYEVVVVDDGSTDATRAIVSRCIEANPRVRLVMHPFNLGYGVTLRSGIRAAKMPWVLLTDANLQFDLGELDNFLFYASDADLIVGWRILHTDRLDRRVNAAAWNWLVRRVFHVQIRDVGCAFKLMRRDLAQRCELTSSGAMINAELVVKSIAEGARVREVGVHHRARVAGEHVGGAPHVIGCGLHELLVLRRRLGGGPSSPVTG